jgi:CRP-like cAMP-binding protein
VLVIQRSTGHHYAPTVTSDVHGLRTIALFETLTDAERDELAQRVEEREFEPGHHVMHQGDGGYTFFVIRSGTADVYVDDALVRSLGPGDFLGELAIHGDGRRSATVTATSQMQLVALFGLEFRRLEAEYPELAAKIRLAMDERQT